MAATLRELLIPLLSAGFIAVTVLLATLVAQRLVRMVIASLNERTARRYRPLIDAALSDSPDPRALNELRVAPERHRRVIGKLLLAPLAVLKGEVAQRAKGVASEAGLLAQWRRDLREVGWWVRAEAALALGLVEDSESIPSLIAALDDRHQQVRAAAVDSLGRMADPAVAPALLARLAEQSRHERARVVEALRGLGGRATAPMLNYAAHRPEDRALVAEILSYVGGADAQATLLEWTAEPSASTRAAAWRALAAIGVDTRAYYYALRALTDEALAVRAAAALALGRTGRSDAAPHLAERLDDDWEVAATAARALAHLGPEGVAHLRTRANGPDGLGRQLAHQFVWEASST